MRDLAGFREAVERYRKQVGRTEEELARELYISKGELNKRLHDYHHPQSRRTWRLKPEHVFKIVETLANWGALTTRKQVIALFTLIEYPSLQEVDWQTSPWSRLHFDTSTPSLSLSLIQQQGEERQARLRTMMADHSGVLQHHLASFMGRKKELNDIRRRIQEMLPTGGYITVTGQAGQGKSSILAQLIKEQIEKRGTEDLVAYHLIPFNPGPDYQTGLLRDLVARLIAAYNLSDLPMDYVAYGNRSTLRDFFPRVLQKVAKKGGQEIIFIDGLDQLAEDFNGERDLTFLPTNPPNGVVFVLGTRPDDTLHSLKLLKPSLSFLLPNLSPADFDLILQHYHIDLSPIFINQFYRLMQGNALFLSLVAKELTIKDVTLAPSEMLKRLENDPGNLFSFALHRLQRTPEWGMIEKILGLLLASQEPLSFQHLRNIVGVKEYQLRGAIARLSGFLTESTLKGQPNASRYSLFHFMFQDFLKQDKDQPQKEYFFASSEVEHYHTLFARWIEGRNIHLIWQEANEQVEQGRREYARRYYINHLYLAKEWQLLFDVLDAGTYGKAKLQVDPSTILYAQDLDLGRLAAASSLWTFDQSTSYLPRLWRYTLLRCSLASHADSYPIALFQLFFILGQVTKAIGLAELRTDPSHKAEIFLRIAKYLAALPKQKGECIQFFLRAGEAASAIKNATSRGETLRDLGRALAQAGLWEQAQIVWQDAAAAFGQIEDATSRGKALRELGLALAQTGWWEQAQAVWQDAAIAFSSIRVGWEGWNELLYLGYALTGAAQWEQVGIMIDQIIKDTEIRGMVWSELVRTFVQAGLRERVVESWQEAMAAIGQIVDAERRESALRKLGQVLAQAGQLELTQIVVSQVKNAQSREEIRSTLGIALTRANQWEHAKSVVNQIEDPDAIREVWSELVEALAQTGQWELVETVWQETKAAIGQIVDAERRESALRKLGQALAQAGQREHAEVIWQEARVAIGQIVDAECKGEALNELGLALAQAGQREHAEVIWQEARVVIGQIKHAWRREQPLRRFVQMLAQAGLPESTEIALQEALVVIREIGEIDSQSRERPGPGQPGSEDEALNNLWQVLAQVGHWDQAQAVLDRIWLAEYKQKALSKLGQMLVQASQWDQAKIVIDQIKNTDKRIEGLSELGQALAQAGLWEHAETMLQEAEAMIGKVENAEFREKALSVIGQVLAQASQWDQAESVISQIDNTDFKNKALGTLGRTLARAELWERAEETINQIQEVHNSEKDVFRYQAWKRQELAVVFAQAGQWDRAKAAIDQIWPIVLKSEAWKEVGLVLVQIGQWEQARMAWQEAESAVHQIPHNRNDAHDGTRAIALRELWQTLIHVGQWKHAEKVIGQIENASSKDEALNKLGQALAQAGQWEYAENVIYQIKNAKFYPEERGEALSRLGQALAKAGQWERAEVIWRDAEGMIRQIKDNQRRWIVLITLGQAWAQTGLLERAEAILKDSELAVGQFVNKSDWWRGGMVRLLAQVFIQVGQWERAEAVMEQLDPADKSEALIVLGETLAQAGQWERAEAAWKDAAAMIYQVKYDWQNERLWKKLWQAWAQAGLRERAWGRVKSTIGQIEDPVTKGNALLQLITLLFNEHHYDDALTITQHAWLQATNRDEALCLLQLAHPFIILKPALGVVFFDAFTWINEQSKNF